MALSDACGDFLAELCEGTGNPKELVRELAQGVEGNASWGYAPHEIGKPAEISWPCRPALMPHVSYGWPRWSG